jgi:hypothetical protein
MGFFHTKPSDEQIRQLRTQYARHFQPPADPIVQKLFAEIQSAHRKEERAWARLSQYLAQRGHPDGEE